MNDFHLEHPFDYTDIQNILLEKQRITAIYRENNQNCLVFPIQIPMLKKNYSMLWSSSKSLNLEKIAQKHNAIYAVIEPNTFKKSTHTPLEPFKSMVPVETNLIDLTQSEEEILKKMHPKGRYNIKVAKKHKIEIKESTDIDLFYSMLEKTSQRDGFSINNKEFIKSFYKTLHKKNKAVLLIAYHNQTPVAGLLMTYLNQTAIYYYGASLHEHRKYMAPYLIQWQAIQKAKQDGYKTYDFLGVTSSKNPKHQLYGVSQFKLKLSKEVVTFTNREIKVFKPFLFMLIKLKKFLKN